MAATARLIVMLKDDEKSALEAEASAANVSTAELARRRLFGREQPEEQALRELLASLKPLIRKAGRRVAANLAEIRALRESAASRDTAMARQTRGELTGDELRAIAERLQLAPHTAGRRHGAGG